MSHSVGMYAHHDHYDYDGNPISYEEWQELFHSRTEGTVRWRVARTEGEDYVVSTVWTGINIETNPQRPPLIFETEVQDAAGSPEYHVRWSSEAEALAGHETWRGVLERAGGLAALRELRAAS